MINAAEARRKTLTKEQLQEQEDNLFYDSCDKLIRDAVKLGETSVTSFPFYGIHLCKYVDYILNLGYEVTPHADGFNSVLFISWKNV